MVVKGTKSLRRPRIKKVRGAPQEAAMTAEKEIFQGSHR